ncbi:MAG: cytochrome c oxidase accessory protein CcoG [Bacteroidetes bacterium]|nr:MAG: cytochrome c oxidase accessory protein CcoG [Bacteroidota bacterium]
METSNSPITSTADNSFRDRISTVDEKGKRIWIYPKKPFGKFYRWRTYVSWVLLGTLFIAPFIKINGKHLILLNVIERKFVFFGKTFWPADFHLFVIGMITLIVFIVLFTVVYGRLFCGWVCPQTIFMEMLFRKIEYWIEGDWKEQMALDKKKGTSEYYRKKGLKHLIFFLISFHIANTFLAYIIGGEEVFKISTEPPSQHIAGLISILAFTGAFYFVFAFLREQVCTTICPYGRLQGVLLDPDSMVVAYDYVRGEPRGKFRKNEDRQAAGKGDCIDCKQCVYVCPTGIDIRNGTQLECINCTACIDACDFMMEKVGLPKGLIRYASERNIKEGTPFKLTTKAKAYTAILIALIIAMTTLLVTRSDVETIINRAPGTLYQKTKNNKISNLYTYKIISKSDKEIPIEFKLLNINGVIKPIGNKIIANPETTTDGAMLVIIDPSELQSMKNKIKIGIYNKETGEEIETVKTTFMAPSK